MISIESVNNAVNILSGHLCQHGELDYSQFKGNTLPENTGSCLISGLACVASIVQDQKVAPVEVEWLRVFLDALDCLMPPVARWAL